MSEAGVELAVHVTFDTTWVLGYKALPSPGDTCPTPSFFKVV